MQPPVGLQNHQGGAISGPRLRLRWRRPGRDRGLAAARCDLAVEITNSPCCPAGSDLIHRVGARACPRCAARPACGVRYGTAAVAVPRRPPTSRRRARPCSCTGRFCRPWWSDRLQWRRPLVPGRSEPRRRSRVLVALHGASRRSESFGCAVSTPCGGGTARWAANLKQHLPVSDAQPGNVAGPRPTRGRVRQTCMPGAAPLLWTDRERVQREHAASIATYRAASRAADSRAVRTPSASELPTG